MFWQELDYVNCQKQALLCDLLAGELAYSLKLSEFQFPGLLNVGNNAKSIDLSLLLWDWNNVVSEEGLWKT